MDMLSTMNGYVKLFSGILTSTLWVKESNATKLVWITMLALKNRDHVVEASIPGLAKWAGVTDEECEDAIERLMSEDKYSRTKANNGKRIQEVEGGWLVLNGAFYKQKMSFEERREYKAGKQAEYREKKRARSGGATYSEKVKEAAEKAGDEATVARLEAMEGARVEGNGADSSPAEVEAPAAAVLPALAPAASPAGRQVVAEPSKVPGLPEGRVVKEGVMGVDWDGG